MTVWTEDDSVGFEFNEMMVQCKPFVDDFLQAMANTGHLGNDTNSVLLRLVGFAMHYYNDAEGSTKDKYASMMAALANNPLAQHMFKQTAEMAMNKMSGVE